MLLNVEYSVNMSTFGEVLKEKRRAAGLSQRQLAERAGVDFSYISKLENDRLPAPAADTTARLAACLGCPVEDLLAAARKMPAGLSDSVTNAPAAIRFLQEASRMRLTAEEWDRMLGGLHGLRSDGEEEGAT
jgi:transcriptional regulator with XRE-family HTH domain